MKFNVNINDNVYVRLTARGRSILLENAQPVPVPDADGYTRWQLWDLMQTFGKYLFNGSIVPFETDIALDVTTYVALHEDRHADVIPYVFTDFEKAKQFAYATAVLECRRGKVEEELTEGMRACGWLYNAKYSCEDDSVRVVKAELR